MIVRLLHRQCKWIGQGMGLFEHAKRHDEHHAEDDDRPSNDEEDGAVIVHFGGRISVRVGSCAS